MNSPLVSIIIPVYNSEAYLAQTIKSALSQTWPNIEILIIDDGSTDNSLVIAETFKSTLVHVLSQKNKGASAARNLGLKFAKGDYIQFLDADDLLSPNKIEAQIEILTTRQNYICTCPTIFFKENENHTDKEPYKNWFTEESNDPLDFLLQLYGGPKMDGHHGGMITVHSWLTPTSVIKKAGLWNEQLSVDDDGEFFFRVILNSEGILHAPDAYNYYRKHINIKSLSAQLTYKGFKSMLVSNYFKHKYVYSIKKDPLINKIFAKYFWFAGVATYPKFRSLSHYAIKKAKVLGYSGPKYQGTTLSNLSKIINWRILRITSFLKHGF